MRYSRQGYEIPIELDGVELSALDLAALERRFGEAHSRLYGFVLEGGSEIVNLRVVATGRVPLPELEARAEGRADPSAAQTGAQLVWTPEGTVDVPTFARAALEPGMSIDGYAIVEQYDATTVVLPGHRATVDPWMNLVIRPEEPRACTRSRRIPSRPTTPARSSRSASARRTRAPIRSPTRSASARSSSSARTCARPSPTGATRRPAPPWEEGSHNEEIYCGLLGLSTSELGALHEDGVV